MSEPDRLVNAVRDAAERFNTAVSEAADAGVLVEVSLEDDPELTTGATPRPKLVVNVYPQSANA